jgi:gamma-glutamyltranspeptidase/glutathione hydrolase
MSPTIVSRDGRPCLALGSPGGTRIIGVTLNVLLNVVDWGMDVQRAIDFPRVLDRGRDQAELEILYWHDDLLKARYGVSGTRVGLEAMGHRIWDPDPAHEAVGGVQALEVRSSGTVEGGADPRREGEARGY